jgi:dynein heavy chain, axonemal
MGPTGGGRNPVTARFLRHFNILSFAEMSDSCVSRIFSTILSTFMGRYFPETVQKAVAGIVAATIHVYNAIRAELLPTPSKSHYTFNLRDMAKVVQGVLRADTKVCTNSSGLLALWMHEATRVFADRLTNEGDRNWFRKAVDQQLQEHFATSAAQITPEERLIYGDFMVPSMLPHNVLSVSGVRLVTVELHADVTLPRHAHSLVHFLVVG